MSSGAPCAGLPQCALTALPGQHVDEDGEEPGPADPGHLHPQAVQVGNCTQEQAGTAHPVRATGRAQQDKEASKAKKVLKAVEHKQIIYILSSLQCASPAKALHARWLRIHTKPRLIHPGGALRKNGKRAFCRPLRG
jgi:hypothetical protein